MTGTVSSITTRFWCILLLLVPFADAMEEILACRVSSDQMAQAVSMDVGNPKEVEQVVAKAVSAQGPVQVVKKSSEDVVGFVRARKILRLLAHNPIS